MKERTFGTIVKLLVILFSSFYLYNLYTLLAKSYSFDEDILCRVDTFHLQSRAYDQTADASGRGAHESELIFKSTNGYSFAIDKDIYRAIRNKDKLEDTLMYHDTKFTVYSDTTFCRKYKESETPIFIRVYQIQIGNEKYIDITKMNQFAKWDKKTWVITPPFLVLFFGLLIYCSDESRSRRTKWKTVVFYVSLFLLLTIVILLI